MKAKRTRLNLERPLLKVVRRDVMSRLDAWWGPIEFITKTEEGPARCVIHCDEVTSSLLNAPLARLRPRMESWLQEYASLRTVQRKGLPRDSSCFHTCQRHDGLVTQGRSPPAMRLPLKGETLKTCSRRRAAQP